MQSNNEYLLPILTQSLFINNWNQIRKLVHAKDSGLKLPEFNEKGTCGGLTFAFIYYHQRGMGNEFFKILENVNNPFNMSSISKDILNNEPHSKELIDFIYMVNVLQKNQAKEHLSTVVDNIGSASVDKGVVYVHKAKDIMEQLNNLKPNDGLEISFFGLKSGHSIGVYKTPQNSFIVYDSNNFKRHHCKTAIEGANKLFNSLNSNLDLYELTIKGITKQIFNFAASFLNVNSLSLPFPMPVRFNIIEKKIVDSPVAAREPIPTTKQILDRLNSLTSLNVEEQHMEKVLLAREMATIGALDQLDQFLTETKLDLNKPLRNGCSVLWFLLWRETNPQLVDLLVNHGAKATEEALIKAVIYKKTAVSQRLLHWGANPNPGGKYISPLFHAINNNDLESVILLIDYGANPNIRNPDGVTPLQFAIQHDVSLEIKTELLRAKADPFLTFNSKPSAFEIAKNKNDVDFINLLSTKFSISSLPEEKRKRSFTI